MSNPKNPFVNVFVYCCAVLLGCETCIAVPWHLTLIVRLWLLHCQAEISSSDISFGWPWHLHWFVVTNTLLCGGICIVLSFGIYLAKRWFLLWLTVTFALLACQVRCCYLSAVLGYCVLIISHNICIAEQALVLVSLSSAWWAMGAVLMCSDIC